MKLTFCTLAKRNGGTLGVRTERGSLNVARAQKCGTLEVTLA